MFNRHNPNCALWLSVCIAITSSGAVAYAQSPAPKLQTLRLGDWYTVTCPEVFHIGSDVEIKVAYRGITEKTTLCCDLHYQKSDGSGGGFYANDWRPKPPVQGDGQMVFHVTMHPQADIASVVILLFTAPDGAWEKHSRLVTTQPISVTVADPGYAEWSNGMKYNKSWIAIDWTPLQGRLTEGDKIEVPVEYSLDPSEHHLATTLTLESLGPRVPKPNAPKPITFDNTQHIYYGQQSIKLEPGHGRHVFSLTVPKASPQNSLLLIGSFSDSRGKRWPWDVRANAWFARKGGYFELETEKPGNLFTYDEPVRIIARLKNVTQAGEKKVLKYKVYDATKSLVAEGSQEFTVDGDRQAVPVRLDIARRGTFLFHAEVDGWESRETTFCRIPDLAAITQGKPTRLGFTVHAAPQLGVRTQAMFEIARRLGLTSCRAFTEWNSIEPGPKHYALKPWDQFFDAAKANKVQTVVTIYDPPAWVMTVGKHAGYQMFPCDLDAFRDLVTTMSKRYQGKFWGWEWLNEITPGGTPDYVADYIKLCRAGVESARAVDPKLGSVLAGGLWPRGYRLDVLNAGVGKYIDALPIHYGSGNGVQEARGDLDSFGNSRVAVWENESSAFVIQWNSPGLDVVSEPVKSKWVMTQWTDELAAGCEKLIYFGGEGDAIGDSDYLLSDYSPLPVAATLAVFAAKTFHAEPVGVFSSADNSARFHLFSRDGQGVLVAESTGVRKRETSLNVGAASIRITDHQGNETVLPTQHGVATLPHSDVPVFIEGADLEVLKTYLVPAIVVPSEGGRLDLSGATPQVTLLKGKPGSIQVRLQNLCDRQLSGTVAADVPAAWAEQPRASFALKPGETKIVSIPVTLPESTPLQSFPQLLTTTFDAAEKFSPVAKPFIVSVISPESVGNLLKNSGFEEVDAHGKPTHWNGSGAELISSEGLGLGLGKRVLKFHSSNSWANFGQSLDLRGGTTYLYTAWIWNRGKEGGSNIMQTMKDGSSKPLYDNQVINIGNSTQSWQVFTCRYQAPKELATAAFVPVVEGAGTALYDNLRVTVFEGSDFAAEAIKVKKPPAIDGSLDSWGDACPIPLIGRNQLRTLNKDYAWTPQNLSGVAYLRWDAKNLYIAVDVHDDIHHPAGDGDTVIDGDSVILAFDPTNRSPEAASKASAYYVSSQKPAGGSGRYTLWRPSLHSGGQPSGHLARDSSVYDLIVKPDRGRCIYQVRIPWSELGISPAFGAKFGFSIQLNDNDGQGPAAQMNWGGGLLPIWHPASFGIITLVE
jgi:hypothetical protein